MSKGGSAPQPVDPYQQAAAQYGLDTGTAEFNAGLNRTNAVNPLGSTTWSSTVGNTGSGTGYVPPTPTVTPNQASSPTNPPVMAHPGTSTGAYPNPLSATALGGNSGVPNSQYMVDTYGTPGQGASFPGVTVGGAPLGSGAPTYTQTTQLAPWAQSELQNPIDASGIAGMPGGPSTTQDLLDTQRSLYAQQMAYIKPQEDLANEQLDAQLANEGITPGSAAYNNAKDTQARANTFTNNQAINSAIQGGGAEQSRLFGLGSQSLQNQIALRNAPINEFNSLLGGAGANATAQTPDISGAFNQAYQGRLAGYNADVASQNADTSAAGSLIASYLMYLALA